MSFQSWIDYIKNAKKVSFISGKLRRIHYTMQDGAEMVEEYSMDTGVLVKRAWKKKRDILCTASADDPNSIHYNWDVELGEQIQPLKSSEFLVKESTSEVMIYPFTNINQIAKLFEWLIVFVFFPHRSRFWRNE